MFRDFPSHLPLFTPDTGRWRAQTDGGTVAAHGHLLAWRPNSTKHHGYTTRRWWQTWKESHCVLCSMMTRHSYGADPRCTHTPASNSVHTRRPWALVIHAQASTDLQRWPRTLHGGYVDDELRIACSGTFPSRFLSALPLASVWVRWHAIASREGARLRILYA